MDLRYPRSRKNRIMISTIVFGTYLYVVWAVMPSYVASHF